MCVYIVGDSFRKIPPKEKGIGVLLMFFAVPLICFYIVNFLLGLLIGLGTWCEKKREVEGKRKRSLGFVLKAFGTLGS